ncbi:hypothetical protein [Siccirubricoccus sp. G192]|uniref:hypothetical protein n=1 Tax=Siccirubricoccus sp. G192 TaxID=2849651 RepID=UPI001C2BD6C3|nr:hypothetical protein [Siccirubricoccus sp. G192]
MDETLGMHPAERVLADGELAGIAADDHRPRQQAMCLDGTPERAFGGQARRREAVLHAADAEPLEVRGPGRLVRKDALRMAFQAGDHRPGQGALAHVGQRLGVHHVVAVPGPQQLQEVQPALAGRGAEPGEVGVADLRTGAVHRPVPRARIVNRDPGRARQSGSQHLLALVQERLLTGDQQAHDLPFGDGDPNRPQLRHQPRHGGLPLMVLGEHVAPEFGAEMAIHPARQARNDQPPLRRQPALAPVAHRLRPHDEVLHQEVLVALEPRAGRHRGPQHPRLHRHPRHHLAAATTVGALARRRRLARLLHPARLDRGPTLQSLEAGDLLALRRHNPLELRHLAEQGADQRLQLGRRQRVRIGRRDHAPEGIRPADTWEGQTAPSQQVLPHLLVGLVGHCLPGQLLDRTLLPAPTSQNHRPPITHQGASRARAPSPCLLDVLLRIAAPRLPSASIAIYMYALTASAAGGARGYPYRPKPRR